MGMEITFLFLSFTSESTGWSGTQGLIGLVMEGQWDIEMFVIRSENGETEKLNQGPRADEQTGEHFLLT